MTQGPTLCHVRAARPYHRWWVRSGWAGGLRPTAVARHPDATKNGVDVSVRTAPQARGPLLLWLAPSLLVLGGMVVWGVLRYPDLPGRIPQHIGPDGVDAWTDKSVAAAFVPVFVYAGVTALTFVSVVWTARITPLDRMPESGAGASASSSLINRPASTATAHGLAKAVMSMNAVFGTAFLPLCWLQWRGSATDAVPSWLMPVVLAVFALGFIPVAVAGRRDSAAKKALTKRTTAA